MVPVYRLGHGPVLDLDQLLASISQLLGRGETKPSAAGGDGRGSVAGFRVAPNRIRSHVRTCAWTVPRCGQSPARVGPAFSDMRDA